MLWFFNWFSWTLLWPGKRRVPRGGGSPGPPTVPLMTSEGVSLGLLGGGWEFWQPPWSLVISQVVLHDWPGGVKVPAPYFTFP